LQILTIDELLDVAVELLRLRSLMNVHLLEDPHDDRSVPFEVPVLIDDLMDHPRLKDLLGLLCKQVNQIVHFTNDLSITHVVPAPLREELLTEQVNHASDIRILPQIHVFPGVLHAKLDPIDNWPKH